MVAFCRSFAIACCSVAIGACSRGDAGARAMATATASASASATASGSGSAAATATATADSLISADAVASKSIGHTSYVLKLTLSDGSRAVFKPRSRRPLGDRRYRSEIAAFRLGHALGLDNVPRAIPRSFDAAMLRRLQPGFDQDALPDPDGRIRGALMPWIDAYRVLPLEEASWRAKWEAWLTDPSSTIPEDQRTLAAAISTMIAFDYLTANWDRWSGANVAEDGATHTVLYVDNDGAFYDPPPADALSRQLSLLRRVVRFSRSFLEALRGLDEAKLRDVFGEESASQPLLPDTTVRQADERRRRVVDTVDARIADAGSQAILSFP